MTTEASTKQCPYCAETIQAAAIVCRYCGRDLVEKPPQPLSAIAADRALLEQTVQSYANGGWKVINRTETTAQLAKPKEWNKAGILIFVALPVIGALFWWPLIWGAILGLLLVTADYLLKKEQTTYLVADQLRQPEVTTSVPGTAARIMPNGSGGYVCSSCGGGVRVDAKQCKHCKKSLFGSAATHAGIEPPSTPPAPPAG